MDKNSKVSDEMRSESNSENRGGTAPLVGRSPGAFAFSSPFGPRIMFAPEGGGGGGADGGNGGDASGADGGDGGDGGSGGDGAAAKPERPDYIPENWWDGDKGFKADDFNALVARDAERAAELAQVPEAADKYEAKLPATFKLPEGFKLPDGQEAAINPDDPRVAAARDFAFANKMSQAGFESLLEMGIQMDISEQGRLDEALKEQVEKLGTKGQERVEAVTSWLGAKLGGELAGALAPMLYTAKQVEAFEALMRLNRGVVPGSPGAGRDPAGKTHISDEEYAKMSPTEKINYARQNSKK